LSVALYFFPTFIAAGRRHSNATPIVLVNLLLGWSMIGWLVALIWAFTDNVKPREEGRVWGPAYKQKKH
jgi:hypothetical protein